LSTLDPRVTPARPDLAAAYLRGRVEAARFADGTAMRVVVEAAPVRSAPRGDAGQLTQALHGETLVLYEEDEEGWGWCQLDGDGYVGWLPLAAITARAAPATHRVRALRTLVFPGPDIKLPPLTGLSLGSRIAVETVDAKFARLAGGAGFVPAGHVAALEVVAGDFVAEAERFLGVPYLWGGKSALGLDCSGLVQVALDAAGIAAPRDSDMQARDLGVEVGPGADFAGLRRGDLIFWRGHVAIARGEGTMIHANAHHMAVAIERVDAAVARIAAAGSAVTVVKRLGAPA
jgi:cell wall-associated NlpC family hydrolase